VTAAIITCPKRCVPPTLVVVRERSGASPEPSGIPDVVTVSLFGLLGVATAALGWGAWHVGQTWDESAMSYYTQGYFLTGWFTDASAVVDDIVNPGYAWLYAYGPIANLIAHAGAVIAGAETWGILDFSSQGFAWRHVMTGLLGLVGAAAVAGSAKVLLGSWRWGVTAATLLMVTPMWLGHAMFNIKDVPVASGYSLAVLGALLVSGQGLTAQHVSARSLWGTLAIAAGTLLAAGTRPAIGVAIAASVILTPVAWFVWRKWNRQDVPRGSWWRPTLWSLLGLVATYLALVLIYPKAFLNPLKLGYEALIVSGQFPFDEPVLTAGMWLEQPPPPSYLPLWFGSQLPIVVLIFGAIGVVLWVALWVRRTSPAPSEALVPESVGPGLVPVLAQLTALPVLAVLLQSPIYNGSRQFLFIVPAMVIVATVGLRGAVAAALRARHARALVTAVWLAAIALMAVPLIGALQLMPYTYVYMNAAASLSEIDDRWPTDYWRASSNELMRRLPALGPESCAYEQTTWGEWAPCAEQPMFRPYLAERGALASDLNLEPGQYWLARENQGLVRPPEGCTLVDSIARSNLWREITIGQIFRCEADARVAAS